VRELAALVGGVRGDLFAADACDKPADDERFQALDPTAQSQR